MSYAADILGGSVTLFIFPLIVLGILGGGPIGEVAVGVTLVSVAWISWVGFRVLRRIRHNRD